MVHNRILVSPYSFPPSHLWQRTRGRLQRLSLSVTLSKRHSAVLPNAIEATVEVQWMKRQSISLVGWCFLWATSFVCFHSLSIEKDIEAFLSHYRSSFPHATVLPKMHILEDHVIPWLKKWRVGAGLMGEQGAESLHSHLHKLERDYAGIVNSVDRLKYIFKMYNIETCPQLLDLKPEIKERQKRRKLDTTL